MQELNKLLIRQAKKYLGGIENIPEQYHAFLNAISDSYKHYEKDHSLLERSIELCSAEMIELNQQLKNETEELKKAHSELKRTEKIRLEKIIDQEKIKNLQEITEAVINAQEKERLHLSAELHDNINQILATSKLYIDSAYNNEDQRLILMKESKAYIHKAMEEIRCLCKSLFPPTLSKTTLIGALEDLVHNITKVNTIQIKTEWKNVDSSTMDDKLKVTIFRIVQEQLNNIFKHAKASIVLIELSQIHNSYQLKIKDNGVGFDLSQKSNGSGMQNIVSRANLFNGKVVIKSKPGFGCELTVFLFPNIQMVQQKMAS